MTAPTEGTAVATVRESVGTLPLEIRQRIELRRMMNAATAQIASLNWGAKIDSDTRRAIAEWGRKFNVDVTTEIDVLGNNVYPNAKYYLRRLGELIDAGVVQYAYADHVHRDPRLDQLGQEGAVEFNRRMLERVKWNIPEDAKGAVVFRVKLASMEQEVVGVNWAGDPGRTKLGYQGVKKTGEEADPIGFLEPAKTAESRAARRCLRQLVSHVPKVAEDIEMMLRAVEPIQARIAVAHEEVKKHPATKAQTPLKPVDAEGNLRPRLAPGAEPVPEVIDMAAAKQVTPDHPLLAGQDAYAMTPAEQEAFDLRQDRLLAAQDAEEDT
jgi:hypothetical protein